MVVQEQLQELQEEIIQHLLTQDFLHLVMVAMVELVQIQLQHQGLQVDRLQ